MAHPVKLSSTASRDDHRTNLLTKHDSAKEARYRLTPYVKKESYAIASTLFLLKSNKGSDITTPDSSVCVLNAAAARP